MSQKEAPRAGLLQALVAGRVTGAEVAAALHLSDRQVRRLRRRFETEGAEGLVHRSRGRPSRRRLARRLRQRVAALLTTTYRDFNDCHATEKLQAEPRCIGGAEPWAGRPNTAAVRASIEFGASPGPAGAPWSSSMPVPSTGSRAGDPP